MHIAVCIPTFNQADHVGGAIESALDQTGVGTEVWVSDDASTDATGQVLARFAGHPRVHLHRQPVNTGIARNAGWVMAQPATGFIVRLDSDDRLHPGYCLALARLFEAEPRAAVVHGAANQVDERGRRVRVRRLARRSGLQDGETALREAAAGYKVAANVCMFRASALRDLPLLYEEGHDFGEDWALFARLADAGWGNIYRAAVAADYRVWSDHEGARARRQAVEVAGITRVFTGALEPAWRRRGWPAGDLAAARRRFARLHAAALARLAPDSAEHAQLHRLLLELAGGPEADGEFLLRTTPIPQAAWRQRLELRLRDLYKAVFYRR